MPSRTIVPGDQLHLLHQLLCLRYLPRRNRKRHVRQPSTARPVVRVPLLISHCPLSTACTFFVTKHTFCLALHQTS